MTIKCVWGGGGAGGLFRVDKCGERGVREGRADEKGWGGGGGGGGWGGGGGVGGGLRFN